jgi:hypothetical protein
LLTDITAEFSQKIFDKWKKEGYHRPSENDNTNKMIENKFNFIDKD